MPTTVMTRKGQVTIPVAFRQALGLNEGDRLDVMLDGASVRLVRAQRVADRTAGILAGPGPVLSAEDLRAAAERAIAEDVVAPSGLPRPAAERG